MLEPLTPEIRQELAAARVAALHRSARGAPPGALRRAVGSALVRLGLRVGYEGSALPLVPQPDNSAGARFEPGTRTTSPETTPTAPVGWPARQANAITLRIPS